MAHLLEAVGKIMADEQTGMVLTKQLAYENANSVCQAALRPYRKKGGLSDYIRICADIRPSYMQGITLAAALQGKSIKEVLYQPQMKNKRALPSRGNAGCFVCGQPGHRAAFCPQQANSENIKTPNLCPRCKKGRQESVTYLGRDPHFICIPFSTEQKLWLSQFSDDWAVSCACTVCRGD